MKLVRILLPLLIILILAVACELTLTITQISKFILPKPSLIIEAMVEEWSWIVSHLQVSLLEAVVGFLIGSFLGMILALAYIVIPTLEPIIVPLAVGVKNVPFVAITPVLFILLGYGVEAKIVIVAVITFFPVMSNWAAGLNSVSTNLKERHYVVRGSKWHLFTKLQLPASIPNLVVGLEIAASSIVIAAIVGELLGTTKGLGFVILMSVSQYRIPLLMATTVVVTIASMSITLFLRVATRTTLKRWLIQ